MNKIQKIIVLFCWVAALAFMIIEKTVSASVYVAATFVIIALAD